MTKSVFLGPLAAALCSPAPAQSYSENADFLHGEFQLLASRWIGAADCGVCYNY